MLVIPSSMKDENSSSRALFSSGLSFWLQWNFTRLNPPSESLFNIFAIILPLGIMAATIQSAPTIFLTVNFSGSNACSQANIKETHNCDCYLLRDILPVSLQLLSSGHCPISTGSGTILLLLTMLCTWTRIESTSDISRRAELQSCRVSQNILEIYFLSDKIQNIKLNQRTFSSSNNIPDLDLISETLLRWVGRITRKTFYNVGVELENDYQESFIW